MKAPLLLRVLREPASAAALDQAQWDLLVRQARAASLLASLHAWLEQGGVLAAVPAPARRHLEWARTVARRHAEAVRWEVACIARALAPTGLPVVLLKGAAYVMADLPACAGRTFSDVDILVPKARLDAAEQALGLGGWVATHHDAYDQRYYRQWMHELPPMRHLTRESVIDVHHAILPETARVRPAPDKLLGASIALASGCRVLAPADMVLHSAAHLFHDGEYDHGLRDLFDLHRLLAHFGADPGFWPQLAARAHELQLARPLFYALRYARTLLGTPVPAAVVDALRAAAPAAPLLALMDALFLRALLPRHASCDDALTPAARLALYVRGNWLRMPPLLLARHLLHKAFLSPRAA